jgi:hypothetical protein
MGNTAMAIDIFNHPAHMQLDSKVLFFYTDICLTFELLRSMTSNVILFKCHLSLIGVF